ncbi:hypothetical protein ACFFUP_02200 [Vibrio ostreicida]|uniref:RDD domain-containing protein n=1 Tax=Vibrio ostreicida TaxID=526588 RepID=A0ABT8BVT4_9VIBR|nr:hypothetical protein [Vibrio ostreicida]MDN3610499.1 hypothetical protein [Vibrio ostreicida]NPD07499.1 hypothetical protein [Vibrio ostreicida]
MSVSEKFRRTGAFLVDLLIAKMFTQVIVSVLAFFTYDVMNTMEQKFSLNDDVALPLILALIVFLMLSYIGVYLSYCSICYRLIGRSLAKYMLAVPEYTTSDTPCLSQYLRKEARKVVLTFASLGLYPVYSGLQLYVYNKPPWHQA